MTKKDYYEQLTYYPTQKQWSEWNYDVIVSGYCACTNAIVWRNIIRPCDCPGPDGNQLHYNMCLYGDK